MTKHPELDSEEGDDIGRVARALHNSVEELRTEMLELSRDLAMTRGEVSGLRESVDRVPAVVDGGTRLLYDHLEMLRIDVASLRRAPGRPKKNHHAPGAARG